MRTVWEFRLLETLIGLICIYEYVYVTCIHMLRDMLFCRSINLSMYLSIYVSIYPSIYLFVHLSIYVYVCVYMRIHPDAGVYKRAYIHIFMCIHIYVQTYLCADIYVCVHTYVYMCKYTFGSVQTLGLRVKLRSANLPQREVIVTFDGRSHTEFAL